MVFVLDLKILHQLKLDHSRDVLWLSCNSWKGEFFFRNFLTGKLLLCPYMGMFWQTEHCRKIFFPYHKKKLKKIKKIQLFSSYIEFLCPKVWKCQALLLIISWSEHLLEYAIFFRLSVRSFWDILSQIPMKNGEARAKTKSQNFFWSKIQI